MADSKTNNGLVQKILDDKIKIYDLNLENKEFFDAALDALAKKPILAKGLNPKNTDEKNLIISWLHAKNSNPFNTLTAEPSLDAAGKIVYLDSKKVFSDEHHDNDVIKTYLGLILKTNEFLKDFYLFQSFTNDLVMKFNFETQKGEEVVYLDKELELPVYLLAKAEMLFKIIDAYAFVKFIDVNLQQINIELILSKFTPLVATALRSAILKAICDSGVSYYDLTKQYAAISVNFQTELQANLKSAGIEVNSAYLKNTSYTNNVNKIFEAQKIEFLQRENDLKLQHKAEILSLENYERKAAIHSKYPSYEIGLTEKEKDNAIDRYITKQRGYKEETVKQVKEKAIAERDTDVGEIKDTTSASNFFTNKLNLTKEYLGLVFSVILLIVGFATIVDGIGAFLVCVACIVGGICISKIIHKKELLNDATNTSTDAPTEDSPSDRGRE